MKIQTTYSYWSHSIPILITGLLGILRSDHAAAEDNVPPLQQFVPFDTSRLMGSPDETGTWGVEPAFPNLKFERPVDLTHAGDGSNRLFVVEQDGRVMVFPNDPEAESAKVFLDLRDIVRREHNEEGLLGLAFHPKYRENGQFFVFYSITPQGSVVARYQRSADDPDTADRTSEVRLLEYAKPYGNHNGGSLKFGPAGYLYVAIGDGGSANDPHGNGQNLETIFGSILRIDVDQKQPPLNYSIPADNPFTKRDGRVRPEIWAYGLRNPWRLAFDRKTGGLWTGDVGQDQFEEIDFVVRGGNYGWKLREGLHPRDPADKSPASSDFLPPVAEYPRVEGKSVTGGFVYRGKRHPTLVGAYLHADFLSGNIWDLRWEGENPTQKPDSIKTRKITRTSLLISSFGEDEAGEIYFTALDGIVRRFREVQTNREANAKQTANFPTTLTETGLFASVKDHQPAAGLIPYSVNVPLWSDGADKHRFLVLPKNASIQFHEHDKWQFPVGTVFVKTFSLTTDEVAMKSRRLETRLWIHNPRGWEGYTYLWNEDQTDAKLHADQPLNQEFEIKTAAGIKKKTWYFPSRSDCQACHTHNAGFVLGWYTRQLNRPYHGDASAENQIDVFQKLTLFTKPLQVAATDLERFPDWEQPKDVPLERLARAYLDTNCAICHSPGGPGHAGGSPADLSFHRSLGEAFPVEMKSPPEKPKWLVPGSPEQSAMIQRASVRDGKKQMPPLATHQIDARGLSVLREWIKSLPATAQ